MDPQDGQDVDEFLKEGARRALPLLSSPLLAACCVLRAACCVPGVFNCPSPAPFSSKSPLPTPSGNARCRYDPKKNAAQIEGAALAHTLTNQEVAILLERYRAANAAANPAFCPPPMVAKTQAYLDHVLQGVARNEEAAQSMRE